MKYFISKVWVIALKSAVALFWCWNILFICASLPLLPSVPAILKEFLFGDVPMDYMLILLAWIVVPWVCIVLARTRLRGRPESLAFLFFAVEGPFYCACLYRLIAMRELNPALMQWIAMAVLGLGVYCIDAFIRPLPQTRIWHLVRLAATSCLALVALYIGTLILLAVSPFALRGLWELISPSNWWHALSGLDFHSWWILWMIPAGILFVLTIGSLFAMPICMLTLCLRVFVQTWQRGPLIKTLRIATVLLVLLLQGVLFVQLNRQPQNEVFALLASPTLTAAQFQDQQDKLRTGLLNAYLGAYRYASADGESNSLARNYRDLLGLAPKVADMPQAAFNALARPILYDGVSLDDDAQRAANLYEQYFDMPIQRGERDAIAHALSATYKQEDRESGLINIDQRKVRVAEQRVQIEAQGDLASITLEETYVNLTHDPQEIFYLFSLPENAAITGLWLGVRPDQMQPHTVATRGAAQRVYKAEVQRRIDPALLEQVGPRQYRLRAYPVPARSAKDEPESALHLRLKYTTLASQNTWPLPVLAEKRNVAWDKNTLRTCNGEACPGDMSTWWPTALPIKQGVTPTRHVFRMDDSGHSVLAQPASKPAPNIQGKKILLVIDQSWSMKPHRAELLAALDNARVQMKGNSVTVLLATTPVMHQAPQRIPLAQLNETMLNGFMGGGKVDQLLQQAISLIAEPQDLTLILTDSGAFDLDVDKTRARLKGGMLSMVHLGGAMAPAYDDATLESIQGSGGSAFASVPEAWAHFARQQTVASGFVMQRDGYAFSVIDDNTAPASDAAFAPIAARLFIANATRQTTPLTVAQLSDLHKVAQTHSVVTPYSSMLVLVNTEQQEALAKAESADDRFDRAQEPGTEILQKPNNPLSASATPEPEEWLLLLVSLCVAGWMLRTRYQQRGLLLR